MTLNTRIYILDAVDPHKVFKFCNALLGTENPIFTDEQAKWDAEGMMSLDNRRGQGLPAWLMTTYRVGAPLYTEDVWEEEDLEEPFLMTPKCYMKLSFDTAYGYGDEFGGCEHLHARYIKALHDWLKEQNVRMQWQNEFTGEYFDGIDGLDTLSEVGAEANEWFRNFVAPILGRLLTEEN